MSEEIPDAVVIWVSLADLRGRELEAYLFEVWLQAVARKIGQAQASTQIKDDFVAQFNQGLVWLLLDGVDEMQATVGSPLAEINRQLRTGTLLQQAPIVLSCRLNLWDGGSNALDSFDNYRTLDFSYPQQVEQFIGNWFTSLSSAEIQTGQRLCAALAESGKERIRDLVKNPLRLTLLCFNWYLGEGKLPETKAGLYEQFVADFYEWKKGQFATTGEQRKRLNAALGELAREAIDKEETRFRLRQEFVCEYLGEPDDADSLFGLALRLGWLNKVGVDGENPRKAVYAFFHPTFQEYFAAKDFCDRADYATLAKHIGEASWNEIFLLACGVVNSQDELLGLMKKETDKLISQDKDLQEFLVWVNEKSETITGNYKLTAIRSFYFDLSCVLTDAIDVALTIVRRLDKSFPLPNADKGLMIYSSLEYSSSDADFSIDFYLYVILKGILAYVGNSKFLYSLNIQPEPFLKASIQIAQNDQAELYSLLANLWEQLPKPLSKKIKTIEARSKWQKQHGNLWLKQLRKAMIQYRNIGHDWKFTDIQKQQLRRYQDANKLLVDCLNYCNKISINTQIIIEEKLFTLNSKEIL